MRKTLAITLAPHDCVGRRTATAALFAAAVWLAAGPAEAAVQQPGGPPGHDMQRAEAVQLTGWDGHRRVERHHRRHHVAPRRWHHRQAQRGYGHHRRGGACRPVHLVGWHHGRRALFGHVLCENVHGQRFFLRGSRYLIRYLHY